MGVVKSRPVASDIVDVVERVRETRQVEGDGVGCHETYPPRSYIWGWLKRGLGGGRCSAL